LSFVLLAWTIPMQEGLLDDDKGMP
jgi:hypothetical protein